MYFWPFLVLFLGLPFPATAFFSATNDTGFWDDFANNFATDLAPIISLFGEQVTKQFLSESTTVLDTIIFAVAPLGILTAIVSCIRVCGNRFLKSLVGRARESHGTAEIEVCSSTSENVCELWSNGGVCRAFGRPMLLEFIYRTPKDATEYYRSDEGEEPTCGIELVKTLFTENLFDGYGRPTSEWTEISNKKFLWLPLRTAASVMSRRVDVEQGTEQQDTLSVSGVSSHSSWYKGNLNFAPFPNPALNIGVQKSVTSVAFLWAAAVVGVLLQASFFGYATWANWYHPSFYQGQKTSNPPLFFTFTIFGTASLVIGMAFSAWLIDRNSEERRFVLRDDQRVQPVGSNRFDQHIFWLQPRQRIGDQQFEAFGHHERRTEYIASWKKNSDGTDEKSTTAPFLVWSAVVLSFFGWAFQFIGLRGQHATVLSTSLAVPLSCPSFAQ